MAELKLKTTESITRPYVLRQGKPYLHAFPTGKKDDRGCEILEHRKVLPGEVVHLTESQARAIADRIESVEVAAKRASDPTFALEEENRKLRQELAAAQGLAGVVSRKFP